MNKLNNTFIEDEITNSYLSYAMSVIIGRALPDVRDGLKPVHRRTLFAMKELNNISSKPYKKSARIVGDVIGKYHPHGEIAVYDSIVRLSQNFLQRYPLIDGQGNFGSIDGDPPAAMRYTEIRMSKIAEYMVKDLDYFTVDYINNYDNTQKYPSVFPNIFPNLLVNGSYGIAVGMATNIPPHNLSEILDACLAVIENKNIDTNEILKFIKGPDFPTCASIYNHEDIAKAYKTGKGKIHIKATTLIEKRENKIYIIVKELPYQINKLKLIEKIKLLIKEKKINGIKTVKDESDKDGLRIAIETIKDYEIKIILNNLYSLTKLHSTFNINMVALINNIPKLLTLKNIITHFIEHRKEIIHRRSNFILSKIKYKFHIIEGLYFILNNIKDIINLITKSKTLTESKMNLAKKKFEIKNLDIKKYGISYLNTVKDYTLSKKQINSTLDIKLNKLVKLETNKILNGYVLLLKDLSFYKNLTYKSSYILKVMKNELSFLKLKFPDIRKTTIIKSEEIIKTKDLINKENIIIILSKNGYIKIKSLNDHIIQHRGGKGKASIQLNTKDSIQNLIITDNYNTLFLISNFGNLYFLKIYEIQKSIKINTGIPIINLLKLKTKERIDLIFNIDKIENYIYLLITTKNGIIKKIKTTDIKKNGTKIINLEKDSICDAKLIKDDKEIMLFSSDGKVIRFSSKEIRCTSKKSYGIIGIKLKKPEELISLICIEGNNNIILSTEKGFGKCTNINQFPLRHRGGKGIICISLYEKVGKLKSVDIANTNDDLLLITESGMISRIKVNNIPYLSRYAKGVSLIKLNKNEKLINIKKYREGDEI